MPSTRPYAHLFSPWQIRHTRISDRVIFGPVCPTWVRSPHEGVFTEQAVAYYEERPPRPVGMIILGGHLIDKDTLYTPAEFRAFGMTIRWRDWPELPGRSRSTTARSWRSCCI